MYIFLSTLFSYCDTHFIRLWRVLVVYIHNPQNLNIYCGILVIQQIISKYNCVKSDKFYTFIKARDPANANRPKYLQIFLKSKCVHSRKTANVEILFPDTTNAKIVQSASFSPEVFQRAKKCLYLKV